MASTSRKIRGLAWGKKRSKKDKAIWEASSDEPRMYPAAEISRKRKGIKERIE
jgi:hypothetical protein